MKRILTALSKHKTLLVIACLAVLIGASICSIRLFDKKDAASPVSYLYNAEFDGLTDDTADTPTDAEGDGMTTKILGEAKLVDSVVTDEPEDTYFTSAYVNRERSRDEALETLQTVIDSADDAPTARDAALASMIGIASAIETEAAVEEMIKAKGFEECIAVMTDGGINVVVKSPGLLTADVAQITEIVMEQTGLSPEDIKIVGRT